MDEKENIPLPPPAPASSAPPPPPPPMPGSKDATVKMQTYKEKRDNEKAAQITRPGPTSMESQQFANLPEKLLNTMKREKKPFTYTPLSVGDNGKLDLSQIKSPRMKKRLMANMKDGNEEENDQSNEIESIDQSLRSSRSQPDQLSPQPMYQQPLRTSPLSSQSNIIASSVEPLPPRRQTSLVRDHLSPGFQAEDSLLNSWSVPAEPPTFGYAPPPWSDDTLDHSLWTDPIHSTSSPISQAPPPPRTVFGLAPPRKINIGQESYQERNVDLTPSRSPQASHSWSPSPQPSPIWESTPIPVFSPTGYGGRSSSASSEAQQSSTHNSYTNGYQLKQIPIRVEYADDERTEPIQSKSFKILQRLTAGIEDELQQLRLLDPLQTAAGVPSSRSQSQQQPHIPQATISSHAEPAAYSGSLNHVEQPRVRGEVRIPVQIEGRSQSSSHWNQPLQASSPLIGRAFSETDVGNQAFAPIPPMRYTGANNPSRSFRLLQMMTGELDDFW